MTLIRAAAGIPVRDGKLLLGLRAPHRKSFANCWDVIGGHVEAGESSEEAFLRELREEIGITPTGYKNLGAWIVDGPGSGNFELTVFRVEAWSGEPHAANDEHAKVEWFDIEAACALPNLASDRYPELFRKLMSR
ncbi:MAG: NUDIX hydrolase [Rhizobiaceae bacterium]